MDIKTKEITLSSDLRILLNEKRFMVLLLLFIAFLAVLSLLVVPSQSGLTSSTSYLNISLQNAQQQYQEALPIQEVDLGASGRSIFIAFVMLSHVLFANLHLGGSWVAAITESYFLRNGKKRFDTLAKSITLFNVILFSAGATFAIAGVLFFISLFPVFASELFHIYWWPLLLEAVTFAMEIFFLYTYWFTWDKIDLKWHQLLGYGYAISVFFQTLLINMVAGGMLTPGSTDISWSGSGLLTMNLADALTWWLNPSALVLQFHRLFGSISFFGFMLVMLAMFHFLDRKDSPSKKHWDWVGSFGMLWGLLGLVIQPIIGYLYMSTIQASQPEAFFMIMHGPRAWEMLMMVGLLSSLFLAVLVYFIDRRDRLLSKSRNANIRKLFKAGLAIAAAAAFILVQPAWLGAASILDGTAWHNPLGLMNYKYVALIALIIVGASVFLIDAFILRRSQESEWGKLSPVSRIAGIFSGAIGMWIVIVMGFVRESARSPWTIYMIIPVPGGQAYPTPVPLVQIFGVWLIVLALAISIFWYTSKVTAYHPKKAEEIE